MTSNKKTKNLVAKDPGEKKHWHKQQRQLRKPKQQPPDQDLADDVKGVLGPRYGMHILYMVETSTVSKYLSRKYIYIHFS